MAERAARSVETLPGSPVVVAIDQGTSSTKVVVVDDTGTIVSSVTVALGQAHPHPGWVQQDADEIFTSVLRGLAEATIGFGDRIAAVGLSSQRESALAWDRSTGQPLGPLLGWQDRRTSGTAADLTNASAKRKASAIYAGSFLEEFVDAKPWAHLDIAGTAWDVGRAYVGNGPTGYGVRLFVALAAELADS